MRVVVARVRSPRRTQRVSSSSKKLVTFRDEMRVFLDQLAQSGASLFDEGGVPVSMFSNLIRDEVLAIGAEARSVVRDVRGNYRN